MGTTPKCFVIMPITTPVSHVEIYKDKEHFVNVLENLFTPALVQAGFDVIPPKSTGSDLIHADIVNNLSESELVLCDMSILNPNVFFEFGIRCALDKPVALVIDDKTEKIPFDTSIINYHEYNSSPLWNVADEVNSLSTHIQASYKKSNAHNALWKYFGVNLTGMFRPEDATKDDKLDYLIQMVQMLSEQKIYTEPNISAFSKLSRQELHVLLHVSEGMTNREIASVLHLGDGTVRNYVSSILFKLGVDNRAEAAAYATEHGIREFVSTD